MSTDTSGITQAKSQASIQSTFFSGQISKSNKSIPISILPDDPEEKRKHIIGLVLKQFPYLSLRNSDECGDRFNLNSSALCPICNGDHKEKTIGNIIKGEWGCGEYHGERTIISIVGMLCR